MHYYVENKRQLKYNADFVFSIKQDILKTIDRICKEHDLQYFAYGKLLIGCVHYQAFIPDDSSSAWDIGMMRDDYEKFHLLMKEHAEEYGLLIDEGRPMYPQRLLSVGKRVPVISEQIEVDQYFDIYISPFDKIPEPFDYCCGFLRKMRRVNGSYNRVVGCSTYQKERQSFVRFLAKKMLFDWRPPQRVYDRLQNTAQKYKNMDTDLMARVVLKKSEIVTHNQIFPTQRMPFGDMMLSCPNDYSAWATVLDDELNNQIKTIQKVDLIILKEFDRVCRELGIGYFVCGGTMLGYVRHGGFIPWDDDIDVGMLREDYDRFLKEARPLLDKRFFLQTRQSDPKIPYLFSKIRMDDTEYITEYNEDRDFHKGICLDLFPFDFIPEEEKQQERFLHKVYKRVKLHNRACNKQLPEPRYKIPPINMEDRFFRIIGKLHRIAYKCIPLKLTQWWYIRMATKNNRTAQEKGYHTVASFVPTYTYINLDNLLPYKDVEFEGITVKVPKEPEVFLEMQYGDFMTLPQKHQQAGHELIRWSANIPEITKQDKKRRKN